MTDLVQIVAEAADTPNAEGLLREYSADVVQRIHGRLATPEEIAGPLSESTPADFVAPRGVFFVAYVQGRPLGCVGLRHLDACTSEMKRLYVRAAGRGHGLGRRLTESVEQAAVDAGRRRICLDTRSELLEARQLYEKLGYLETEPYAGSKYAQHWFAKNLPTPQ